MSTIVSSRTRLDGLLRLAAGGEDGSCRHKIRQVGLSHMNIVCHWVEIGLFQCFLDGWVHPCFSVEVGHAPSDLSCHSVVEAFQDVLHGGGPTTQVSDPSRRTAWTIAL